MKKWEYKRVALNPSTASGIVKLDNYGENGWELVMWIDPYAILKREIKND